MSINYKNVNIVKNVKIVNNVIIAVILILEMELLKVIMKLN